MNSLRAGLCIAASFSCRRIDRDRSLRTSKTNRNVVDASVSVLQFMLWWRVWVCVNLDPFSSSCFGSSGRRRRSARRRSAVGRSSLLLRGQRWRGRIRLGRRRGSR